MHVPKGRDRGGQRELVGNIRQEGPKNRCTSCKIAILSSSFLYWNHPLESTGPQSRLE